MRKILITLLLAWVALPALAEEYVLAVNEGVTYQDAGPISERYKPLVDLLEKALKGTVKVKAVDRYSEVEKGLQDQSFDLAFIHPAHISLRAVKSGNYVGVASAREFTDYRARIIVPKGSTLTSIKDLQGKKIGVPAIESITTVMLTANLRDLGINNPEQQYMSTRYQDAVPFMVENGFTVAGVTGSGSVAKAWIAKGGKVLAETPPVPIKQFLVSSHLSDKQKERVSELLLKLDSTPAGADALKGMNIKGFVAWNDDVMRSAISRLRL